MLGMIPGIPVPVARLGDCPLIRALNRPSIELGLSIPKRLEMTVPPPATGDRPTERSPGITPMR